tara:strand:- start:140 stop:736 length:597 start_codon:yes stop_codon:yes gene_type:complete
MRFISTFKKYTQESKPMNPRIFVGAAAGVLVAIIVVFTLTGTSVISDVGGGFFSSSTQEQTVLPLAMELFDLSILEVTEKQATLEIKFKVSNPNFKSVMLQHIKYSVYHDDVRITAGELGSSPEGFLSSPNYFIILNERPSIIGEKFTIMNTGNTPELWEVLTKNELNWRVSGEAFFNLSSITAGQENILKFDFSKQA